MSRVCILPSCPPPTPSQKGQEGCWGQEGQGTGSAASGLQQWGLLDAEEPQNQGLPSGAAHGSSVVPFSSQLQSFPESGSFQMSQFFALGGQSIRASASAQSFQ